MSCAQLPNSCTVPLSDSPGSSSHRATQTYSPQLPTQCTRHGLKRPCGLFPQSPPGTHNFDGRTLATPSPTARMYLSGLMGFVNHFSNRTMVHSKFWKHYTINRNGHPTVISLDRLKAAHMEPPPTRTADTSHSPSFLTPPTAPPQRVTCSGRHAHWPQRLVYYA
jgi:hypothetical protein